MNEKINLQNLVVLLAEKANIAKKDAETLVKNCFDTMIEGLIEDKLLKIKNLGTFKLVQVEDRESVDISTGERVLIPAHYKVTFLPDTELVDTVNAPSVPLETLEIVEDEVLDETEDESEISDEINLDEKLGLNPEEQEPEEPEMEEPEIKQEEIEELSNNPPRATNGLFWFFFLIASALILFFAGRYFCPMINSEARKQVMPDSTVTISCSAHNLHTCDSLKAEVQTIDSTALCAVDTPKVQTSGAPVEQASKKQAVAPKAQSAGNQMPNVFDEKQYKVRSGERLNTIALREYGHKVFWVYIYDENRDIIRNPDLIEPGMLLNIPPAGKYGIDKNNRTSVDRALELERKYKP